jgi:hypothetical protein
MNYVEMNFEGTQMRLESNSKQKKRTGGQAATGIKPAH